VRPGLHDTIGRPLFQVDRDSKVRHMQMPLTATL